MRANRIDSDSSPETSAQDTRTPADVELATQSAIMLLLLSTEHDGPWTRTELELELSASPLDVQDAIAGLYGAGLVHLQGELVIASRAAQRMDELES